MNARCRADDTWLRATRYRREQAESQQDMGQEVDLDNQTLCNMQTDPRRQTW